MNQAEKILKDHLKANLGEIEILITESNRKEILPLYRDYTKMGFSPNVIEKRGEFYLVADVSSQLKSNVVDISLGRKRARVIEVDFESKKVICRN